LAISDDLVAVLAPGSDIVDLFPRSAAGWTSATPSAVLTFGPDVGENDGSSIAISDNTVFVGFDDATVGSNASQGAVYAFTEPTTGWQTTATPTATLTAADGATDDDLGLSIAASGSTVVAGEVGHSGQGAADVFLEPAGGWTNETQNAELTATAAVAGDSFGSSVAIQGDTIAVGADDHAVSSVTGAGLIYVYTKPSEGWTDATQNRKLQAEYPEQYAFIGGLRGLAVVGNTVAATDESLHEVDMWTEPDAGWGAEGTQQSVIPTGAIPDPDGAANDNFGGTLVSDGVRLGVTSNRAKGVGAVLLYTEPTTGWSQASSAPPIRVPSPTPQTGSNFGGYLAMTANVLVVAANNQSVNGQANAGEEFLYAAARPALSSVKQSHKKWTLGKHTRHTNVKHKPSGGTTFSFSLNEAATVTLKFTEKNKHGHYDTKHTITVHAKAGTTREYVDGPLGAGKKLTATKHHPGHCKVAITATNANGISATKTLSFEVKKATKH
jgi:hypothetical protein